MATFPYVLTDKVGNTWQIDNYGEIDSGVDGVFYYGASSSPYTYSSAPVLEMNGRQIVYGPAVSSGLTVSRKVYVSQDGFVRYLETYTNTGTSAINRKVEFTSSMNGSSSDGTRTSDGNSSFEVGDNWIVWDNSTDARNPAAHVVSSKYGLQPSSVSESYSTIKYGYDISLQPGETKSVMHFVAIGKNLADTEKIAKALANLQGDALNGLTDAEIDSIVNFTPYETVVTDYVGTSKADVLIGDSYDEFFDGKSGDDVIYGDDGNDTILGGAGNDTLLGGEGNDRVWGGTGNDVIYGGAGNDWLYGDDGSGLQTSTASKTVKSTGEKLSVSLTLPDASNDTAISASGFVSRTPVTSSQFNIAFVIDVSGSVYDTFSGKVTVGDLNGDGRANTILDAEIAGFEALLAGITKQVGAENVNVAVIPFDSTAWTVTASNAAVDANGNGRSDVVDALRSLRDGGSTNFEAGLQQAMKFFNTAPTGQNLTFFLSDGENNMGGSFTDEVSALMSKSGINSTIRSFGVGANASKPQLDLVDDNKANDSVQIVLDPSDLSKVLIDPGIKKTDVHSVELYVNGKLATTISGSKLTETPLGLRFSFDAVLKGLDPNKDDKITAKVIGRDPDKTTVQTTQTVEVLKATDGHDTIVGGAGHDFIWGGGGNDKLYGSSGNDTIYGETGDDKLDGGRGSDRLFGGDGNDRLDGGLGADYMEGGKGNDIYYVDRSGDKVVEKANEGTDTVYASVSYKLTANVEKLVLTGTAASGTGNSLSNTITGNKAANTIKGSSGNDTIKGEAGADKLYGDSGNDKVYGGSGNDKVYGGSGNDSLFGDSGDDSLYGDSGNDKLDGGTGHDKLYGGSGNDTLVGGSGNDRLYGGTGNDILTGGSGKDIFVFDTSQLVPADNVDTITDFNVADDTIWLARSVFSKVGAAGALKASAFNIGSSAADSSDRVIYNKNNGKLYYDADGKGGAGAIHFATLSKGLALTADDFFVI